MPKNQTWTKSRPQNLGHPLKFLLSPRAHTVSFLKVLLWRHGYLSMSLRIFFCFCVHLTCSVRLPKLLPGSFSPVTRPALSWVILGGWIIGFRICPFFILGTGFPILLHDSSLRILTWSLFGLLSNVSTYILRKGPQGAECDKKSSTSAKHRSFWLHLNGSLLNLARKYSNCCVCKQTVHGFIRHYSRIFVNVGSTSTYDVIASTESRSKQLDEGLINEH